MTNIYFKYNPYTVESEIKIDGLAIVPPNKLADLTHERLQVWVEDLMPILNEICNDDMYEIDFYGTSLDYEDLSVCINEYCEKYNDTQVIINRLYRFPTLRKLYIVSK